MPINSNLPVQFTPRTYPSDSPSIPVATGIPGELVSVSSTNVDPMSPLSKSNSLPNIAINGSAFSHAKRSGGGTLWKSQPVEFNDIRKGLCQFVNGKALQFAVEPSGKEVDLSRGNPVTTQDYTQPTSKTCHLTSFLSATHDLLAPHFAEDATVTDKLLCVSLVLTAEEREHVFTDGFSLQQLTDIGNRLFDKYDIP